MPRFSTYKNENKIKLEKKKMVTLIRFYDEMKMIFPILLAYSKTTENKKEKINITANLAINSDIEQCGCKKSATLTTEYRTLRYFNK
mgnify:CR=1 FL=1